MGGQSRAGYALRDPQPDPGSARNVRRLHPASALPGSGWARGDGGGAVAAGSLARVLERCRGHGAAAHGERGHAGRSCFPPQRAMGLDPGGSRAQGWGLSAPAKLCHGPGTDAARRAGRFPGAVGMGSSSLQHGCGSRGDEHPRGTARSRPPTRLPPCSPTAVSRCPPPGPVALPIALAALDLTSKQPRDLIPRHWGERGGTLLPAVAFPGRWSRAGFVPMAPGSVPPAPSGPGSSPRTNPSRLGHDPAPLEGINRRGSRRLSVCPASPAPPGSRRWAVRAGTGCRSFGCPRALSGAPGGFSAAVQPHPGPNIPARSPLLRRDPTPSVPFPAVPIGAAGRCPTGSRIPITRGDRARGRGGRLRRKALGRVRQRRGARGRDRRRAPAGGRRPPSDPARTLWDWHRAPFPPGSQHPSEPLSLPEWVRCRPPRPRGCPFADDGRRGGSARGHRAGVVLPKLLGASSSARRQGTGSVSQFHQFHPSEGGVAPRLLERVPLCRSPSLPAPKRI